MARSRDKSFDNRWVLKLKEQLPRIKLKGGGAREDFPQFKLTSPKIFAHNLAN